MVPSLVPNAARQDAADPAEDSSDDDMEEPSSAITAKSPPKSDSAEQPGYFNSQLASQKRRRVTRACDECRRKKIKCDGKSPCAHCSIYGYDCTYDQPSNRRRNPAPQYVEALERRLKRAEAVIHTYLPNIDLDDDSLNALVESQDGVASNLPPRYDDHAAGKRVSTAGHDDRDLESMVAATGQLDIDEKGNWDYHGHSSGLSFIRQVRNQLGDLDGPEQAIDDDKHRRMSFRNLPTPGSPKEMLGDGVTTESPYSHNDYPGTEELPSRELAMSLCSASLDDATGLVNIIHQPSFYERLDRIYDLQPTQYNNEDQKFLPLLYVVLALGCLHSKDEQSELEKNGYKSATGTGYKYFWASRQLIDVTDCRDITNLQVVVFMTFFLQCSAKLATCYAYIGLALRSAMRMGLHRSFQNSFNPIESEIRKRIFWTIRKLDVYVSTMLGLPLILNDQDIDQEFPLELSDECITKDKIDSSIQKGMAPAACANAEFRLLKIFAKIVKTVYPIKGLQTTEQAASNSYSVSSTSIREIENELEQWRKDLPRELQPTSSAPPKTQRMQQMLRMFYAHTQLILYRPFLHYVSSRHQIKTVDQRSYACAAACVSVSRNIIHLTTQMKDEGLLQGSYWFTMYASFFGILSLVFFVLENPNSDTHQDVLKDAIEGKEVLATLAKRSMAADRCTKTLNTLFDNMGPALEVSKKEKAKSQPRKREASESKSAPPAISGPDQPTRTEAAPRGNEPKGKRGSKSTHPISAPASASTSKQAKDRAQSYQRPIFPSDTFNFQSTSTDPADESITTPVRSPFRQSAPALFHHPQSQSQSQGRGQSQGQQQQLPFLPSQFQNQHYATNVNNMSAVMFPSDNPFAYPNQPMTTLEQNYAFGSGPNDIYGNSNMSQDYLTVSTAEVPTVSADEQIDEQLFGPMPPYGSSSQTPSSGYQSSNSWYPRVDTQMGPNANMHSSAGGMSNIPAMTHGIPGLDLNDLFAGGSVWRDNEDFHMPKYESGR